MPVAALRQRTTEIALGDVRVAGAVMLVAAAVRPHLPGNPGLPCPLRTLTGVPCPLCGLTTSVTATIDLRLRDAVAANPAGIVAVAAALALLAAPRAERIALPVWLAPLAVLLMWIFELHRFAVI